MTNSNPLDEVILLNLLNVIFESIMITVWIIVKEQYDEQ